MADLDSRICSPEALSREQFLSMCGVAFDDAVELAPPDEQDGGGDFAEALAIEVRERLYARVGCGGGHFLRGVSHVD